MLEHFGWSNWTEARMASPNTALVFRVVGFQPEVGAPRLLLSSRCGVAAPVGGGLWPVLLWWISPSQEHVAPGLFSLTRDCGVLWRFGFLPACYWSQHGRFPTSHADDQVVMWQTHICIHTSNNTVYQFYHAEIIALFVVYLPNPCKSFSGSLLWLLNEINFQNHRHARALLKPLLRVSCCIMQYVCSNGEKSHYWPCYGR